MNTFLLLFSFIAFCAKETFQRSGNRQNFEFKSVFMNGYRVDLNVEFKNELLQFTKTTEDEYSTSSIKFVGMKCECADSINYVFKLLYGLINECQQNRDESSSTVVQCLDKKETIAYLEKINRRVEDAITTLFHFAESNQGVISSEPFVVKTLLMIHFYVTKLSFISDNIEYFGNEKSMYYNHVEKLFDMEYLENVPKPLEMTNKEFLEPNNISFVILQITNLTERLTIESCYTEEKKHNVVTNETDVEESNEKMIIDQFLEKFSDLLTSIGLTSELTENYYRYNKNDALLEKCFGDRINEQRLPGCDEMRSIVKIRETSFLENGHHENWVKLQDVYKIRNRSFDIRGFFEKIKLFFNVIMKLVYQKSVEFLKRKSKAITTGHLEDYVSNKYPNILTDYLTFLDRVNESYTDGYITSDEVDAIVKKYVEPELKDFAHISIDLSMCNAARGDNSVHKSYGQDFWTLQMDILKTCLSLEAFLCTIFDDQFTQFWLVLDLIESESEKTSNQVYGMFLTWHPYKFLHKNVSPRVSRKCNSLRNIYWNYFFIEKKAYTCLSLQNSTTDSMKECFMRISDHRKQFSNHMLRMINGRVNETPRNNHNLRKIIVSAVVQLRNVKLTELNANENFEIMKLSNIVIRRVEMLKRAGREIMNLLDNYQMHNCPNIKTRFEIYGEFESDPLSDRIEPIRFHGVSSDNTQVDATLENNDYLQNLTREGTDSVETLTAFAKSFFFKWSGEIQSFSHISQVHILYYTLGFYRFVEYQHLLYKWLISTYYTAWLMNFEFTCERDENSSENIVKIYDRFLKYLFSFKNSCDSITCTSFEKTISRVYYLISVMDPLKIIENEPVKRVMQRVLVDPVRQLSGVVRVDPIEISSIREGYTESENFNDISTKILTVFEKKNDLFETAVPVPGS